MKDNRWVVDVSNYQHVGKYNVNLTIWFGGRFVHTPIAEYIGGGSIVFRGVTGSLVGEEHVRKMCLNHGLCNIKGFYRLQGNCFMVVRVMEQYTRLFSKAIIYNCGNLTLYADIPDEYIDTQEDPMSQVVNEDLICTLNDVEIVEECASDGMNNEIVNVDV